MNAKATVTWLLFSTGLIFLGALSAPAWTFHLDYSTYLGGGGNDRAYAVEADSARRAFLAGSTLSADFPTADSCQQPASAGGEDAFLAAFSADGSSLVFSTYLGGSGADRAYGLAVDEENGYYYLCGFTASGNFPVANPYQGTLAGDNDVFVSRLDAAGALDYSTFLGGTDSDIGMAIAVSGGDFYVTGETKSAGFPTVNPYQGRPSSSRAAFLTRFHSSGSSLVFSTYLGGNLDDRANDLAVGPDGSVYLAGYTKSSDFPTLNPYRGNRPGSTAAFMTRFSSPGSSLISSTYLGGANNDFAVGMTLGGDGSVYLAGNTFSDDFPTVAPFQGTKVSSYDAFLTRFSSSGSSRVRNLPIITVAATHERSG